MTADQRQLLANYVAHARDFSASARLPVGPMVDAVEAALMEIDQLKAMKPNNGPTRNLEHYSPQEVPNRYPLELCPDGHICLWEPKGETKITVAYLYADNEGDFDLKFVGDRPLDSRVNWLHFRQCVEQGFKMMRGKEQAP